MFLHGSCNIKKCEDSYTVPGTARWCLVKGNTGQVVDLLPLLETRNKGYFSSLSKLQYLSATH